AAAQLLGLPTSLGHSFRPLLRGTAQRAVPTIASNGIVNPDSQYIHGTDKTEQERLVALNRLTNPAFVEFLDLRPDSAVLEVGSGVGILAGEVAGGAPQGEVIGME